MKKKVCPKCNSTINFLDVFVAGLPHLVKCSNCGSNINFRYNSYILYSVVGLLIILLFFAGVFLSNLLIGYIPIKKRYIRITILVLMAVILDCLLSFWLLNFASIKDGENSIKANDKNIKKHDLPKDTWDIVIEVARLIAGPNVEVHVISFIEKVREIGKNENEEYVILNYAESVFGKNIVEWFGDDDLKYTDLPCAAFKTSLNSYGLMEYLDGKIIFDPEEMFFSLNRLLKTLSLEEINIIEKQKIDKNIITAGTDQNKIANVILSEFDDIAKKRGYNVLWFDEDSDSYSYFIVKPDVYEKLQTMRLDENHKFYRPRF